MKISIKFNNNIISFKRENELIYFGEIVANWFKTTKILYNKQNELVSKAIFFFKYPLKIGYKVQNYKEDANYFLLYKNFFSPKYFCSINSQNYFFYPHKGHKTSIFIENIQIGYYEKETFSLFDNVHLKLICNSDVNLDIILSFIMAIEYSLENENSTFSADLGNFGPEAQKFNKNWKPDDLKI